MKINKKIIIVGIILLIGVLVLVRIIYKEGFENESNKDVSVGIPKIIHQTAPADKAKWHKDWYECQESWKKEFPDFEYKMWTDEDNLKLIETDYPWFLETYKSYEKNIMRVDMIRYFILDKYGGIYADMDYKCIKNFLNELPQDKVAISESPFPTEYLQNALMCSPKKHPFWMKVINEGKRRWDKKENAHHVLYISGPELISKVYEDNKTEVNVLPIRNYNPDKNSEEFKNENNVFTKHLCTASWI